MITTAVFYTYADDPERLAEIRPAHREHLGHLKDEGKLLGSGPLEPGGALILMNTGDTEEALAWLSEDPFLLNGMIVERSARRWTITNATVV